MSDKSRQGRAEWEVRGPHLAEEIGEQVRRRAEARQALWAARGRIPLIVRATSRLAGRPVRLKG